MIYLSLKIEILKLEWLRIGNFMFPCPKCLVYVCFQITNKGRTSADVTLLFTWAVSKQKRFVGHVPLNLGFDFPICNFDVPCFDSKKLKSRAKSRTLILMFHVSDFTEFCWWEFWSFWWPLQLNNEVWACYWTLYNWSIQSSSFVQVQIRINV